MAPMYVTITYVGSPTILLELGGVRLLTGAAERRNFSIGGGRQVLTVREQRSKRDAMAAPRAAWESVHRTSEMRRCSAIRRARENRYTIERWRRGRRRADVRTQKSVRPPRPGAPVPNLGNLAVLGHGCHGWLLATAWVR